MQIWLWIIGLVEVVTVVAMVVDRRRGPSGSSRKVDFIMNNRTDEQCNG